MAHTPLPPARGQASVDGGRRHGPRTDRPPDGCRIETSMAHTTVRYLARGNRAARLPWPQMAGRSGENAIRTSGGLAPVGRLNRARHARRTGEPATDCSRAGRPRLDRVRPRTTVGRCAAGQLTAGRSAGRCRRLAHVGRPRRRGCRPHTCGVGAGGGRRVHRRVRQHRLGGSARQHGAANHQVSDDGSAHFDASPTCGRSPPRKIIRRAGTATSSMNGPTSIPPTMTVASGR